MIENFTGIVMTLGSLVILIQNYSHYRKYPNRETLFWIFAAIFTIFVGIYFAATRYFIPIILSNVVFLIWSRHILITLALLSWAILGFRTYILGK